MISVVGPEGGYCCGSGLGVIVTEFRDWQEFLPVVLLIVAICSKGLFGKTNGRSFRSVRVTVREPRTVRGGQRSTVSMAYLCVFVKTDQSHPCQT